MFLAPSDSGGQESMQMIIASEGSQERKQTHQEIRSESKTDERMK